MAEDESYLRDISRQLGGIEAKLESLQSQATAGREDRKAFGRQLTAMQQSQQADHNAVEARQTKLENRLDAHEKEMAEKIRPAVKELHGVRNRAYLILGFIAGLGATAGAAISTFFEDIRRLFP